MVVMEIVVVILDPLVVVMVFELLVGKPVLELTVLVSRRRL